MKGGAAERLQCIGAMGESTEGLEQTLVSRVVAEPRLDPELLEFEDSVVVRANVTASGE